MLSTCIEPLATASPCIANLQQLQRRPRRGQQRIGGHHRGHRRGRRTAEPEPSGMPLSMLELEAKLQIQRLLHGHAARGRRCSAPPRAADPAHAADRRDATRRLRTRRTRGAIAERIDREAEDVETDRDIADRGRRKARGARARGTPPRVTDAPRGRPTDAAGRQRRRRR